MWIFCTITMCRMWDFLTNVVFWLTTDIGGAFGPYLMTYKELGNKLGFSVLLLYVSFAVYLYNIIILFIFVSNFNLAKIARCGDISISHMRMHTYRDTHINMEKRVHTDTRNLSYTYKMLKHTSSLTHAHTHSHIDPYIHPRAHSTLSSGWKCVCACGFGSYLYKFDSHIVFGSWLSILAPTFNKSQTTGVKGDW